MSNTLSISANQLRTGDVVDYGGRWHRITDVVRRVEWLVADRGRRHGLGDRAGRPAGHGLTRLRRSVSRRS